MNNTFSSPQFTATYGHPLALDVDDLDLQGLQAFIEDTIRKLLNGETSDNENIIEADLVRVPVDPDEEPEQLLAVEYWIDSENLNRVSYRVRSAEADESETPWDELGASPVTATDEADHLIGHFTLSDARPGV